MWGKVYEDTTGRVIPAAVPKVQGGNVGEVAEVAFTPSDFLGGGLERPPFAEA